MSSTWEEFLRSLPIYLPTFGGLLTRPKRFMASKNTKSEDTLRESLMFLVNSVILATLMTAPLLHPGVSIWMHVSQRLVATLLGVAMYAVALRIAWAIVGGRATVRSFFVTYAYFTGVLSVVFTFFQMLGEGIFRVLEPRLYVAIILWQRQNEQLFVPPGQVPGLEDSFVRVVAFLIFLAGVLASTVWGIACWGAYRELNGLSRRRSFVAFVIMGVLGLGVALVVFFVSIAMTPLP